MSGPAVEEPGASAPPLAPLAALAPDRAPAIDILVSITRPWTLVVCLSGEHGAMTGRALQRLADDQLDRCDRLAVDVSHATSLDPSVIDALVEIARRARPRGVTFHVVSGRGSPVREVLEERRLLGVLGCIECLPEMQAAHVVLRPDGDLAVPPPTATNGAAPR